MATNYTEHYQLSQWEPEDSFLREEFNENLRKIDQALGLMSGLVTGRYVGDGTAQRLISLGFTPTAVLVVRDDGQPNTKTTGYGGLALAGWPALLRPTTSKQYQVVTITDGGFLVYRAYLDQSYFVESNYSKTVHHYIALR